MHLHLEAERRATEGLRRQFTSFICDVALERVSGEDLKRLAQAASSITGQGQKDDLRADDFSLISRAYYFWGRNGFEWQDNTECMHCGRRRADHATDGSCAKPD